jgi:hypothetical protein
MNAGRPARLLGFRREALGSPRRVVGGLIGIGLLGAAVWVVWSNGGVVEEAWRAARDAPAWLIALAMVLPLGSWVFTSLAFWLLSRRFAPVPLSDMSMLIGAAWLLNHLPLRPGMVGRVAFHKKYHGLAVRESVRVMAAAMVCTGLSLAMLLAGAAGVAMVEGFWAGAACLAAPTAVAGAVALIARAAGRRWWLEIAALCMRSLDMLSWLARYAIVFVLVGHEVTLERLVVITAVCQVAMVVPVTGNGMGLREWAVGLTLAAMLGPGAEAGAREQAAAIGLAADLVNRAAETLLAVPVGLACSALLARRVRRLGERNRTAPEPRREIRAEGADGRGDPADTSVRTDS